jgi:hypothetical protein
MLTKAAHADPVASQSNDTVGRPEVGGKVKEEATVISVAIILVAAV